MRLNIFPVGGFDNVLTRLSLKITVSCGDGRVDSVLLVTSTITSGGVYGSASIAMTSHRRLVNRVRSARPHKAVDRERR